ncbi:fimbrial protein [Pseudomonas sp. 22082]|uniref:fimbrial protein n=1 Tax=Pseudomonas sp. 22082 TaxID=3453868 RepID=UPI003F86AFCF
MSKRFWFFLLAALMNSAVSYADCSFLPGNDSKQIIFKVPSTMSVPDDFPIGGIIYESPNLSFGYLEAKYRCSESFLTGVVSGSAEVGNTYTFRIGNSGVAFQWFVGAVPTALYGWPSSLWVKGEYGITDYHQLKLIKIGPIKNGTLIGGPGGLLASWKVGQGLIPMTLHMNNFVIQTLSCETPDVKVTMGREVISALISDAGLATVTDFQIPLNRCPEGINGVTYSLTPVASSPALDARQGIIALNPQSTAIGAAIQINDTSGTPMVLDKKYPFKTYSSSGGSFNIPLSAKYVRAPLSAGSSTGIRPGTANGEIAFIIEYL